MAAEVVRRPGPPGSSSHTTQRRGRCQCGRCVLTWQAGFTPFGAGGCLPAGCMQCGRASVALAEGCAPNLVSYSTLIAVSSETGA